MQDSKSIKKVFQVILFFVVLVVLIKLTSELFAFLGKKSVGKVQDRNTNITGIQIEEENTIDVLVLGDSESYTSISPMQLYDETGVTAYICGQSGQRIIETYHALETAFKTQTPKVVMIETNTFYRKKDAGTERSKVVFETLQYNFQLFRYHNLWKRAFYASSDTRSDYKGFVIRNWSDAYEGGQYMKESKKIREVDDFICGYMDSIVEMCNEKGTKIVLYSAPSPKNYNMAKHNGLVKFAEKYGVDYIDLNEKVDELQINWKTDTADKGDHLNLNGAQKVTSYIGLYLKENHELTDYRQTELSEKWNKLVDVYKKDIEKSEETLL